MSGSRHLGTLAALALVAAGLTAGVDAAGGGQPGGELAVSGTLVDRQGEHVADFELAASESPDVAGVGGMFFSLSGPSISACDAHGPGAEPGTNPLAEMECGGTGNVSVAVDGCTAVLETHGIVHADHPYTVYLGTMTVDIEFRYDARRAIGRLNVDIHTPKDVIRLAGTTDAVPAMDTCS